MFVHWMRDLTVLCGMVMVMVNAGGEEMSTSSSTRPLQGSWTTILGLQNGWPAHAGDTVDNLQNSIVGRGEWIGQWKKGKNQADDTLKRKDSEMKRDDSITTSTFCREEAFEGHPCHSNRIWRYIEFPDGALCFWSRCL
ncbi:hypothetical protein CEXT_709981 [Caerostris extrusa]|uniref:Uncharacterized protein n=1 Tax=Caerostris extrusa TaxID=172846 RepID=A0AAV4VTJ7_CAEEX|nr:hypothetical protein CEXT_709981 [Caerostris extrusa]